MSVSLRELTVADTAVLRNISIATFTETFADSNSAADMELYIAQRFSENQLAQELTNPESFFYTAEVQGRRWATSSSTRAAPKPNRSRRTP